MEQLACIKEKSQFPTDQLGYGDLSPYRHPSSYSSLSIKLAGLRARIEHLFPGLGTRICKLALPL